MRTNISFSRLILIALAAVSFSPSPAYCQSQSPEASPSTPSASAPGPEKQPGKNNEIFKTLRARCEIEAPCGKASGDICVEAAAILLGDDPPDEFRDMNEAQKVKIALRLLEKGVDSSNLAAGRAYDWYNKTELFGFGTLGGYTDAYRANELMELMIKRSYPGGVLRKARTALAFFSLTATETDKKQACATAKQFLAGGKLDADSTRIANEMMDTGTCKSFALDQK